MVSGAGAGLAFVFPGQASQKAGMATELLEREPVARQLFQKAGEVLGLDLAELCTTGSDTALARTDITQPALLTTCVAWHEVLRERGIQPQMVAGHSLGEFSAWVAAGTVEFEEALRLVRRRGELMEEAATRRPGGMVAVIGLQDPQVAEICERAKAAGVVVVANHNSPGQVVVSGEAAALDRVTEGASAAGGKTIPLRVSGAFHSPLMEDAAFSFANLVSKLALSSPRVPVVANSTAEPVTNAEAARQAMSRQMTSPVLWTASVRRMVHDGVRTFVEVGPGQVLSRLIERISSDVRVVPVGGPGGVDGAVAALAE
jgi:[acyl-carrier-protein] S-malonyltransferase